MLNETEVKNNEAQIRAVIYERVEGVNHKDVNALIINHASDAAVFDVLDPLHYEGVEQVKERAEKWLSGYETAIGYEIRDLKIKSGADTAFCHYLYHVTGTLKTGGEVDMWVRATVCFQKSDGEWKIVHEHQSVPFNVETGKASLNLKP
ncbi:MAG: nuclear transport factor 2 family protein [Pyrinomonadaceae bacterium]